MKTSDDVEQQDNGVSQNVQFKQKQFHREKLNKTETIRAFPHVFRFLTLVIWDLMEKCLYYSRSFR